MNWYIEVLKKYAVFGGRARRTEYWMFVLFNIIIAIAIGVIEGIVGSPAIVSGLYSLGVLIPSLAVAVRRLHDTDRSGWWILIALVPVVGFIVLLVFMVQDGTPGENQHGQNPKADPATAQQYAPPAAPQDVPLADPQDVPPADQQDAPTDS
ncbi:DUF805 domain-containing protein [bacterium]|nr:DUF805 domain-containing protein [bacterium]